MARKRNSEPYGPTHPGIRADDVPKAAFEYWLTTSHGFLVDAEDGEVGIVEDIVVGDDGSVTYLTVAVPRRRERALIVAEDVALINPLERRLLLHERPHNVESRQPGSLFGLRRRRWR